jgi:hypothetical protein
MGRFMLSTISDALVEIDGFESRNDFPSPPWKLDRAMVASRLKELVNTPTKIQQGDLNLCGPAVFFLLWCKRDPLAFSRYCINLFEQGSSAIGSLNVIPGSDLRNQDYEKVTPRMNLLCPQAEWLSMSALRDSENAVLDFEGTPEEDVSGITTPAEIKNWLDETKCYQSVQDEGNYATNPGLEQAKKLRPDLGQDIVMLINANLIPGSKISPFDIITGRFPNHYILLDSPIEFSGDQVSFTFWTWGMLQPKAEINKDIFDRNYFGAVIASL